MKDLELLKIIETKMPFEGKAYLDSDLFNDLGFDSALLLDLIVSIEEQNGFYFSDENLYSDRINTPRKILEMIQKSQL
jgi:acyl carrier protein